MCLYVCYVGQHNADGTSVFIWRIKTWIYELYCGMKEERKWRCERDKGIRKYAGGWRYVRNDYALNFSEMENHKAETTRASGFIKVLFIQQLMHWWIVLKQY